MKTDVIRHARTIFAGISALVLTACGTAPQIKEASTGLTPSTPKSHLTTSSVRVTRNIDIDQLNLLAKQAAAARDPISAGYKIGPHDVLEVSVFNVPELSKTVSVAESGTINYPLVGEMLAAGRTARDLEFSFTKSLGAKYLQRPQISIMIAKHNSQRVTVEGAVKKPGVYPLLGKMSLLQLVATAEGLTEASDNNVVVFRQIERQRTAARFSIANIRDGSSQDPILEAGDVVVANVSATKKLFNDILKAMPVAGLFAVL